MLEIILDTETTGISTTEKHRIVEIGCLELRNQIPTNNIFHTHINPKRKVSEEAYKVHGYSDDFLKDKKLIIHNAPFDLSFLNYELSLINREPIDKKNVIDTLEIARTKFPGAQNSLDALCKRYNVDNSRRDKHNALIDCHLLKEVYINLLDQKEPKLNLENAEIEESKYSSRINNAKLGKIIEASKQEIELHQKYLKTHLPKNNFN